MKKPLIIFLSTLITWGFTEAQELVVNGGFSNNSGWTTASPMGATDEATFTFNYLDDNPEGADGGCLSISSLGQNRSMVWQQVVITPGHRYKFSGLIKNSSTDALSNTWVEVLLSRNPVDSTKDFGVGKGDYIYRNNSWMTDPWGKMDDLNGTLLNNCEFAWIKANYKGSDSILTTDEIYIPDTVTLTTWTIGIKAGIWNDAGGNPSFRYLFDNISLYDLGTGTIVKSMDIAQISIYPTITKGIVNIKASKGIIKSYSVYNTAGLLVKSGYISSEKATIDLSGLSRGIYYVSIQETKHKIVIY